MSFIHEKSGQVSVELILLIAGVIIIVLLAMNVYQNYVLDFNNEIEENELNNLLEKIDKINVYIKEDV